ncbi:MAG: hypothetical protein CM15mP128_0020 [Methanobacteriota archaeon]|nr:MAG: hypothetical protein CM15mP128_0020 [Euryarchaeota archaeon]
MREALQASGVDVTRGDVAAELTQRSGPVPPSSDEGLDLVMDEALPLPLPTILGELPLTPWPISRTSSGAKRRVEAACRHFLSIGKVSDSADDAFLDALTREASTRDDHTSARPSVTV